MQDIIKKEFTLESYHDRPFLADVTVRISDQKHPVILFAHGFKGFKDWGHFNLLAEKFANEGFVFFKFNMSHNGTTIDDQLNFRDLDAFGHNNFSKELDDIDQMISHILDDSHDEFSIDPDRLFLIGHSRGGGVSIIKGSEDERVAGLTTWAALADFSMGFTDKVIEKWRKEGVHYFDNARTGQKMPVYFQAYEDVEANRDRLNPENAIQRIDKPTLIIHGDNDETVPVVQAHHLSKLNPKVQLHIVKNGNHVFGGTHPFNGNELHSHTQEVLNKTVSFFKTI